MSKSNFIFHHDYINTDEFAPEEIGMLVLAMIDYSESGKEPEFTDRAFRTEWSRIKRRMDDDIEAYEEKCRKNQENGRLGGRPKKTEENRTVTEKTERFSEKPKKPDSDYDTDIDTEEVIVCVSNSPRARAREDTHTPTEEEVIEEAKNAGSRLDREEAKRFLDYNAAAGWKLEWRYALKLWLEEKPKREERHTPKGKTGKSALSGFAERKYDYAELEHRLLADGG